MGWLPCIRRGSDRWWLPRSAAATDIVTQILLAPNNAHKATVDEGTPDSAQPELTRAVANVIAVDPPLFLYCALSVDLGNSVHESVQPTDTQTASVSPPSLDIDTLACWLIGHAHHHFASGESLLGAPILTDFHDQQTRRLLDHYRALPLDRWMDDAVLWLQAFGPKVSSAWQHQWPTFRVPTNGVVSFEPNPSQADTLQQLARAMQRLRSLESAFDARLQKSKLGAIKQLTYGLSHEINNPLANISTRAQSLQRDESDPARVATLQRIIDQVYRAHEMIADLMFYANPHDAKPTACNLAEIIRRTVRTFDEEAARQSIRMELSLPDDSVPLSLDETMIGEAIRVLIRNAIEAIGCQGTVVVSLVPGETSTQIHVADSGPGLSPEARQHAFDPYFSGREAGRGLGLGLCRAYRIAKLHQAEITLAGGPTGCVATITMENDSTQ